MANASILAAFERMWLYVVAAIGDKQERHSVLSISLLASSWSNMQQTVTVSGVTANGTIVVTPSPTSHVAYCEAGVYCSAQADGTLTFACSDTPDTNLTVNVMVLN